MHALPSFESLASFAPNAALDPAHTHTLSPSVYAQHAPVCAPMDDEGERDEREKLQRRGTSKDLLRAAQEHQYQLFLQQQQLPLQQQEPQHEQEPLLLLQQKEHSGEVEAAQESVQERQEERAMKDRETEIERDSENERVLFTAPPPLNAVSSDSGLSSPAEKQERGEEERLAPRIDTSVGALGLQQQSSSSVLPSPASFSSSVPSLQHMFRNSFAFAPSFSSPFPPTHEHMMPAHAEGTESADVRAQRIAHSQIMMGAHYPHPYTHAHAHTHAHPMMLPFGGAPSAIPFAVPPVAVDTANAASSSAAAAAAIAEAAFTSSNTAATASSAQNKSKKGKAAKRSILATVSEDQEKSSSRGGDAAQREQEKEGESESTPAKKKTKRRPSGFILFAREQRRHVVDQFPAATFSEIGKILGLLWAQQSREQKQVYVDAAKDWALS